MKNERIFFYCASWHLPLLELQGVCLTPIEPIGPKMVTFRIFETGPDGHWMWCVSISPTFSQFLLLCHLLWIGDISRQSRIVQNIMPHSFVTSAAASAMPCNTSFWGGSALFTFTFPSKKLRTASLASFQRRAGCKRSCFPSLLLHRLRLLHRCQRPWSPDSERARPKLMYAR